MNTQERLRTLSHRIGREHNNRRSLLEPPTVTGTPENLELVDSMDKETNKNFDKLLNQDGKVVQDVKNEECSQSLEDNDSIIDTSLPISKPAESS